MIVQVWYTVPVCAMVDTETGKVDRVVTIDESIALDPEQGVTLEDYSAKAPADVAKRAIEIAEGDNGGEGWPRWEYGF